MAESESESSSSSHNNGSSPITRIPQDQLFSILLLLPVESILCLAMTCKKLKSLAYSDSLWESICRRDWDWGGQNPVLSLKLQFPFPWKKMYQQVYQLDSVCCHRLDQRQTETPRPRASHSLSLVSGCLILFGGGCEGGRHLDDTWAAYIGTGGLGDESSSRRRTIKWQKTNPGMGISPSGRFGHSCVVIGDCVVLFGGINDLGMRQNDTWIGQVKVHHHQDQDQGSSITLSWRLLDVGSSASASAAPPPRGAHAGCFIDNRRMLIHGGIGPSGVRLGDTWVLEVAEDMCLGTWREIQVAPPQPCPPSRSGHTLTHIRGTHTILFGGRGMGYQVLNDVWVLEEQGQGQWRWRQLLFDLRTIPQGFSLPRVGHSASLIIGRRLLIYGGEDSLRHRKDDFWVLDTNTLTLNLHEHKRTFRKMWKRLESHGDKPICRSFHGACVDDSGRYLYVHGGMVDGLLQPADPSGLRFDGENFLVELVLHR